MTAKMRRIFLCSMLALMLTFGFAASAQAASGMTVNKLTVGVKGVGTYTLNEFTKLSVSASDVAEAKSIEATTAANKATLKNNLFRKIAGKKGFAWAPYVAKKATTSARNMNYVYKNKKMVITNATTGHKVTESQAYESVKNAFMAAVVNSADGASVSVAASINPTLTKAGISSRSKLGKCIVVDKSQRRLWLYNHGKKVLTYRVTVGMKGHSTPNGTYTIGAKRNRPTWGNPGSAWAKRMPKTIKAGPNNPLGLRAMNLNRNGRDTGLRIHGTSNNRQIGTASSHGCIRVANKNIVKLYPKVPKGTLVIVQP